MKRKEFLKTGAFAAIAFSNIPNQTKSHLRNDKTLPKIVRKEEGTKVNVIGDQQTFKLTGKDTAGQFTLIEEVNAPGTMIPPHVHTKEDEIFKVLEGKLEVTVGNSTTILEAGDLAYAPKNIPHSWKVVGDTNCKTILSAFPAGIERMFAELGELPPGKPDFAKVAEICKNYGIRFLTPED